MKHFFLLIICHLSLPLFCQETISGPWKLQYGASSNTGFIESYSFNLRCVSPRFKYSNEDWTEEMGKHPEKYKRARFMFELLYTPPLKVICSAVNLQYRLLKYKRLSVEIYGGVKFLFVAPRDFIKNPNLESVINKQGWYMNVGPLLQLDLGLILPFVDLGYDGLVTIGAEFNFHAIYKKPKKRYKLHARKA